VSTFLSAGAAGHKPDLLPQHLDDLGRSGLRADAIAASGVYSLCDPDSIRELLGGYLDGVTARNFGACLAFPFFDPAGEPMTWGRREPNGHQHTLPYVRMKPDRPRMRAGKPVKYESPKGSTNRVYVPPPVGPLLTDPAVELLVVEGEKKALASTQDGFPTIGLSGVWNWMKRRAKNPETGQGVGPRALIDDFERIAAEGRRMTLVFDSDLKDKPEVELARWCFAEALRTRGVVVRVVDLPDDGAEKWGLDDFLVHRGVAAFRGLLAEAREPARPCGSVRVRRRTVVLGDDEHRVNDEVVAEVVGDPAVYQRAGQLVRVTTETPTAGGPPVTTSPRIETIPPPALRDLISRRVAFRKRTQDREKPAHPPAWSVNAVSARGHWPGARRLTGVVPFPVVRADGSVLTAAGYDKATGLYLHWTGGAIGIPERPTLAEAKGAAARLLDVVGDIPFASDLYRGAWLAALLTPLARPAFVGPAPLFLVDANVRAAGKGLSLEVIAHIVTGHPFPVVSYPANPTHGEEELRKKITTLLMLGDRLALFDNLTGQFGDGTLDRALTGAEWQDRVLGVNDQVRLPLAVTFYATGNNVAIRADTARRVCHVRLESPHERPEERSDLKRPRLLAWVRESREHLLADALTVLRGYYAADRPDLGLTPWGSFEGWSAVVRNAVAWVGLPDPGLTRLAVREQADETARGLSLLIDALEVIDPDRHGKTAAEIVTAGEDNSPVPPPVREAVREAVETLVGKPDGRKLGNRLRHLRKRVVGGKYIDQAGADKRRLNRWAVFGADKFHQSREHAPRAPHPLGAGASPPPSEDVEHVEHVTPADPDSCSSAAVPDDEEVF
jgi:hypothetical protein